jgi:sarcosine oxidase
MSQTAVVVGGGINGLFTARELEQRGFHVTVIDPRPVGHDQGSSYGTRNINVWWSLQRSGLQHLGNQLWTDFEKELPPNSLRRMDCVQLLPEDKLEELRRVNRDNGQPAEILSGLELQARYGLNLKNPGLFLAGSCRCVVAHRVTEFLTTMLRERGVTFLQTKVKEIGDGEVVTDCGTVPAELTVLAAGPWLNQLLDQFGFGWKLTVSGQIYSIYHSAKVSFAPERWPLVEDEHGFNGTEFYSMPDIEECGLKVAVDGTGPEVQPTEKRSDDTELQKVDSYVRSIFPGDPVRIKTSSCWYTLSPDGEPMIGWLPGHKGRILLAHSCAGGGVKSSPATAKILGCLASGKEPPINIGMFSPDRFN